MTTVIAPPTATPRTTGPHGFSIVEQPIDVVASSPTLASGRALAAPIAPGGKFVVDADAAKLTFSYGVVLYRTTGPGVVEIFDGGLWHDATSFDFGAPGLATTDLALDVKTGEWRAIVVLSTDDAAKQPLFETDATTLSPRYGFLSLLRTPKVPSTAVVRSSPSAPMGVVKMVDAANIGVEPRIGTVSTTDLTAANGLALVVKDGAGATVVDLVLSDAGGSPSVVLELHTGSGVAAFSLDSSGNAYIASPTKVTVDAPRIETNAELRVGTVQYQPHVGGSRQWL